MLPVVFSLATSFFFVHPSSGRVLSDRLAGDDGDSDFDFLGDFDVDAANSTLHLAWSAFCSEEALTNWNCGWCQDPLTPKVKLLKYMKDWWAGTQGYVGLDMAGKRIVVGYRGSSNLPNGMEDADFLLVRYPPAKSIWIRVDQGFYSAFHTLKDDTLAAVEEGLKQCAAAGVECSVLFTGHSLGASMATLGAVELLTKNKEENVRVRVDLFNFGSPRTGNKNFVDYALGLFKAAGGTVMRMARERDIVPTLPPEFLGYRHMPTEVWNRHAKGKPDWFVVCDPNNGEDPKCFKSEVNIQPSEHTRYMGFDGGNANC